MRVSNKIFRFHGLGFVAAFVLCAPFVGSAQAEIKINPYPQGVVSIGQTAATFVQVAPVPTPEVLASVTEEVVVQIDQDDPIQLMVDEGSNAGDAAPDDSVAIFVDELSNRPRRFTSASAAPVPVPAGADVQLSTDVVRYKGPWEDLRKARSEQRVRENQAWQALQGATMKETLDAWSEAAGVDFVWDGAYRGFDVRRSETVETSYEGAVEALLDQYRERYVRPVGRLYVSPHNGKRVLVVEVVEGV